MEAGTASRSRLRHFAVTALGATLLAVTSYSAAQITAPNGSQPQDNRKSAADPSPDTVGSGVHESFAPQSKDSKGKNVRGPTVGKDAKPEGSAGFANGLDGTGTGSNN
jgi:hypothetical protein